MLAPRDTTRIGHEVVGNEREAPPGRGVATLDPDGFGVVELFDHTEVRALRRLVRRGTPDDAGGFFASVAHAHGRVARDFDLAARDIVRHAVARVFPDMRLFLAAVTAKPARSRQVVPYHHDWTYTDERVHRTWFLWCPLVDTDDRNGTLHVVPGSHRWLARIRPSRPAQPLEEFQDRLAALATPVPVRAGSAIAFDPALVHGSGPNRSWRARPAVTLAVVTPDAPLLHFHQLDDGRLLGAVVGDPFFTEHPYGTAPTGYPPAEPWDAAVHADDIAAVLDEIEAGRPRGTGSV